MPFQIGKYGITGCITLRSNLDAELNLVRYMPRGLPPGQFIHPRLDQKTNMGVMPFAMPFTLLHISSSYEAFMVTAD